MRYLFFAIISVIFLLQACKSDLPAGFTRSNSGMVYKHHIDGKGEKPQPGYKVFYHVDFRRLDSVVNSSRSTGAPAELIMAEKDDGNFLRESLMKMGVGDSLTMIRLKDSIQNPLPPEFQPGDIIYIDIAVKGMQSKEDVAKEKAKVLSGFSPSPKGTLIKKVVQRGGKTPKVGEGVVYELQLKRGNTLVYSSFTKGQPNKVQLPPNLAEVIGQNPIMESLTYMSEGDSLNIAIEYDSIPQLFSPQWGFQSGDLGLFEIRLDQVLTKQQVEEEKQKYQAEKNIQKQATPANAKRHSEVAAATTKMIKEYEAKNIKGLKTLPSGLEYLIVEQGDGYAAGEKNAVSVHYSGFLLNGKEFDSSFGRGQPITFTIGEKHVIDGWDEGIEMLNQGGKAYLFVPPNLAYGELGRPPKIPGNSKLAFYVELVEVKL